jgi:ribosomal protein S18 acetylase RimI-like enzyme
VDLEALLRFWRAQDDAFERVEPAWWGAVVSDARYPLVQEPNYARVEARQPVQLAEVEEPLVPAMRRSGSRRAHVVVFHPEEQSDLIVQASTRRDRLVWDLVMSHDGLGGEAPADASGAQEVDRYDDGFWTAYRASLRWFDVTDDEVADQLETIEREALGPMGRRWFAVRSDGGYAALAALSLQERIGFLDHVVTFPQARRRGYAAALTRRAVAEASAAGATATYLLAEPDGAAARLYASLGFRPLTQIASWISELDVPA